MKSFSNFNFNFIKYSKFAYIISGIIILIGILLFFTRGIRTSIDFSGGTVVNCNISKDKYDINFLRDYLTQKIDQEIKVVEEDFDGNDYTVLLTMQFLDDETALEKLLTEIYQDKYQINMIESIGGKIGDELQHSAIKAIITAMIFIGIYITFRFDSFYAIGSLIAIVHDVAITFTGLMIFQYEISISIIAALLTIVGYSLNDTIVIYDRVRENLKINFKVDRNIVANNSLNITLNRTIITSLTTLMVAFALFIVGGDVLKPFSMALIIGVITGTYSSLFIATPIMLILEDKYKLEDLQEGE